LASHERDDILDILRQFKRLRNIGILEIGVFGSTAPMNFDTAMIFASVLKHPIPLCWYISKPLKTWHEVDIVACGENEPFLKERIDHEALYV
jgi:hypothetical protein